MTDTAVEPATTEVDEWLSRAVSGYHHAVRFGHERRPIPPTHCCGSRFAARARAAWRLQMGDSKRATGAVPSRPPASLEWVRSETNVAGGTGSRSARNPFSLPEVKQVPRRNQ